MEAVSCIVGMVQWVTEVSFCYLLRIFYKRIELLGRILFHIDNFISGTIAKFQFKDWIAHKTNDDLDAQKELEDLMEIDRLEASKQYLLVARSFWTMSKLNVKETPVFVSAVLKLIVVCVSFIDKNVWYRLVCFLFELVTSMETGYLAAYAASYKVPGEIKGEVAPTS